MISMNQIGGAFHHKINPEYIHTNIIDNFDTDLTKTKEKIN